MLLDTNHFSTLSVAPSWHFGFHYLVVHRVFKGILKNELLIISRIEFFFNPSTIEFKSWILSSLWSAFSFDFDLISEVSKCFTTQAISFLMRSFGSQFRTKSWGCTTFFRSWVIANMIIVSSWSLVTPT